MFFKDSIFLRKNALKSTKKEDDYLQNFNRYLVNNFNPEELDRIAKETGFIERSGKIDAFKFLTCLVFNGYDQKDTSLLNLKIDFWEHHDCDVSRVAIHKRFNASAVEFMKRILSQHIAGRFTQEQSMSTKFTGILIKDSTKFSIPKNLYEDYPGYNGYHPGQALMNLQYEFDMVSGNWKSFEITKATRNDQEDSKKTLDNIEPGTLLLRDLGYVTMTYLKGVSKREAYYLNRLPTSFNVFYKEGRDVKKIDWAEVDEKMGKGKLGEMELSVFLGNDEMLPSRLIIQPVPEEVYQERIRKAAKHAKSKGCQLSKEYKIKSRYNLFITNTPKDQLSTSEVRQVYRLRWQIELIFKTWKSNLKIHVTKKVKKERFECQLIAKIIWIVLNWRLFQIANLRIKSMKKYLGCSVVKFFKQAKSFSSTLRNLIIHQLSPEEWFRKRFNPLIPNFIIEQKNGKQTHCQIFNETIIC